MQRLTHGVGVKEADVATEDPGEHVLVETLRGIQQHLEEQKGPGHGKNEDGSDDTSEDVDLTVVVHDGDGDVRLVVAL